MLPKRMEGIIRMAEEVELRGEMDLRRYGRWFIRIAGLVKPVFFIILGLYCLFWAPETLENDVELNKRQLMGILLILLATFEWRKKKEEKESKTWYDRLKRRW